MQPRRVGHKNLNAIGFELVDDVNDLGVAQVAAVFLEVPLLLIV